MMFDALFMLGIISILIAVHEFGHFVFAKIFGVGVQVFSIGFGKILCKKKIGETNYAVSAIPLGGYVKMEGEESGEETSSHPKKMFSKKPLWQKLVIVLAGPLFNFLLAFCIFIGIAAWDGIPIFDSRVGEVMSGFPAADAGLRAGDVMVGAWIDGTFRATEHFGELSSLVSGRGGQPIRFLVRRMENGMNREFEVIITPVMRQGAGMVGITAAAPQRFERATVSYIVSSAASQTARITGDISGSLWGMISGRVSFRNIGGPIRIVQLGGQVRAAGGMKAVLFLTALFSVNLGVFNLLPVPVLDGGHLPIFFLEAFRRRPLSKSAEERVKKIGVAVLLTLMFFASLFDITRLFQQ